jgi:hypothetical protein
VWKRGSNEAVILKFFRHDVNLENAAVQFNIEKAFVETFAHLLVTKGTDQD